MSENWKFQINLKIEQHLINVRAENAQEFADNLKFAAESAGHIANAVASIEAAFLVVRSMGGAPSVKITTPPVQVEQFPSNPVAAGPTTTAPVCKHGAMVARSGNNKQTGKPWTGFFCPAPKGTPDQCSPIFDK